LGLAGLAALAVHMGCGGDDDGHESPPAAGSGGAGGAGATGGATSQNVFVDILPADESGCLPRALIPDETAGSDSYGQVPCSVLEATFEVPCSCDAAGRISADTVFVGPSRGRLEAAGACNGASGQTCDTLCLCEIEQLGGEDLTRCQNELDASDPAGFCYIDESLDFTNPELVADCPAERRQRLRFLDPSGQTPRSGATVLIACSGTTLGG
jgi:hypothetical protein